MSFKISDFAKVLRLAVDTQNYKSGEVIRYNGKHKIKQESVSEHSFMTAMNIIQVCRVLNIEDNIRNKAVTMSILHDISEVFTGDVAYEFKSKKENKDVLKTLFEAYEESLYNEKYEEEIGPLYKEVYEENNDTCGRLVSLGDSMSVVQYSTREISLGNNTEDMLRINNEALQRVNYDYERLLKAMKEDER